MSRRVTWHQNNTQIVLFEEKNNRVDIYQHHEAGLEMEPTGKAEKREAKEKLVTVNGGEDGRSRLQLETVTGETIT